MPQDLLDLIEMRQRVLNPLNEEFSIFMELLGYLSIKEEEREFQKCSSQFSSVQLLSHIRLFVTPFTAASQASLSITNSWSLLKLMSIELVMDKEAGGVQTAKASRKQSSLSGKESAQGCIPKRLLGRPD